MLSEGLTTEDARSRLWLLDSRGLVHTGRVGLEPSKQRYAQSIARASAWECPRPDEFSLTDVVKNVRPTILIGTSAQPRAFTEEVVRLMASHAARPLIFPLSNPTSKCEAAPCDLIAWTDGRAIVATGSPFPEVDHGRRKIRTGQCNNCFIFPGVGLGVIASGARRVTDEMFVAAARVREYLCVQGMTSATARLFRDKLAMRFEAEAAHLLQPEFVPLMSHAEVGAFLSRVPAPWIIKPRADASAIGIHKLLAPEEVWREMARLDAQASAHERAHSYLLERYVPGDVYHVNSLVAGSRVLFADASRYARPPLDVTQLGGVAAAGAAGINQSHALAQLPATMRRPIERNGGDDGNTNAGRREGHRQRRQVPGRRHRRVASDH